jgi:hypothetical protein
MQATPARPVPLDVSDLRPGDVLLSCGDEALSELIRRLDGGDYSHAAVWDGKQAVDATARGVVRRDLSDDIKAQWYIDAYRWHSPPPDSADLGHATYPPDPVIARSDRIVDEHTKFAYDELIMGALVIALSRKPTDKWLRISVRLLLSRVEEWVREHITAKPGTTAMTCSETVAVSFDEAVPPKYTIEVDVDPDRDYQAFAPAPPPARRTHVFSSYDALKRRYAELFAEAEPNTALRLQAAAVALRGVGASVDLPPGSVTPRDLQTSPSLTLLGRLSETKEPPDTVSHSTLRLLLAVIREYWPHRTKTLSRS